MGLYTEPCIKAQTRVTVSQFVVAHTAPCIFVITKKKTSGRNVASRFSATVTEKALQILDKSQIAGPKKCSQETQLTCCHPGLKHDAYLFCT